ncbi:uncharacterized protein Z518_09387 [Rhinocladiella mackenziei CBS 650.93]|uniref:Myb-like domain-containing protein n=1 Tax=Rhinocladiella mackenziei CBS 650.93 TaxID=1442369 RepID=A0A0D2IEI3_9EURO|nr:uncharacterized protein Z518_09387 [Rhinocladiella mackenziei CBS 650.93]KIX01661.1 hypothetical protein Z518_09387 [Rhinocladiella mackenziei CBS 650.93]
MSNLFDAPWTTSEKIALLTNIIQGAVQDVPSYLVQGMVDSNIQPRWSDIALPEGRSLAACQQMYDTLVRAPRPPRPFSSIGPQAYAPQQLGPSVPPVRTVSEHELHPPTHRSIQPRPPRSTDSPMPPATNGEAFTILRPFAPELGMERRRKRGRPTKEEAEERDRRLAAAGQTYEPKKRPAKKPRPSGTPSSLSEALPGTLPGSQTTPLSQHVEPKEETSSGKRRSKRQREEDESSQQALPRSPLDDSGNERSTEAAQSPSDRLLLRKDERAQAVASGARDVQQAQSPTLEHEPEQRQDDQQSGPPST